MLLNSKKDIMEFLFHSVYHDGHHSKFYNVYKVDDRRFFAQCHHFNHEHVVVGDFELVKEGGTWKTEKDIFATEASYIGEEIDRVQA